jgi:hypothetical protein
MSTPDPSPASPDDIPSSPQERLKAIAAILATGLLRLHTRPELAPNEAAPIDAAMPEISAELGGTPLASARG